MIRPILRSFSAAPNVPTPPPHSSSSSPPTRPTTNADCQNDLVYSIRNNKVYTLCRIYRRLTPVCHDVTPSRFHSHVQPAIGRIILIEILLRVFYVPINAITLSYSGSPRACTVRLQSARPASPFCFGIDIYRKGSRGFEVKSYCAPMVRWLYRPL